ncbi:MAG: MBL fold metallo-hydrolase [Acidimicrobiia bacterium]|nr:MBL fold metallo-hydrolase [Acidimicrobiia bacterium]
MRLELTVLGTASQASTRDRSQGGYVLRWDDELILFDPGEGSQRQLLFAGLSPAQVSRVCVTHFHGDHCLGLPGLLQTRALVTDRPIVLHHAAGSDVYVDHLLAGSVIDFDLHLVREPIHVGSPIVTPGFTLSCRALEHPTPAIGYRVEAPPARHLLPGRLDALGIHGADIGRLRRAGEITSAGRTVTLDEVSETRSGPAAAFVMDSSPCDGARQLAAGADLLICESTYLRRDVDLARRHGHMTAEDAGTLAAAAGVGLLVLSHFSGRYEDPEEFAIEAGKWFQPVIAARDLCCIPLVARAHATD